MAETEQMAVIGVLARVCVEHYDDVVAKLRKIAAVTPFSVGERGRLGVVIERPSLAEAAKVLHADVETMDGVLAAWPVFSHFEPCSSSAVEPHTNDVEGCMGERK